MGKQANRQKRQKTQGQKDRELRKKIEKIEKLLDEKIAALGRERGDCVCFPLLMGDSSITASMVDDTFKEIRAKCKTCDGKLEILVESSGGDIDAAYNLAMLFRKYGTTHLKFIVPRWAKSAATLLVCSGDEILMSPVAELGPLDPQITALNPLENRIEQFSPLSIEATLDLIRNEYEEGSEKLAKGLTERLQFPLTLGTFMKSLDISEQYIVKLLESRMLKGNHEKSEEIAKRLTKGYADHGFCINVDEARNIGLSVGDLNENELDLVMEIHELCKQRTELERKFRQERISDALQGLPPAVIEPPPGARKPDSDRKQT